MPGEEQRVAVDDELRVVLDLVASRPQIDYTTLSPPAFRRMFAEELAVLTSAPEPSEVVSAEDRVIDGPTGPLRVRLYRPTVTGGAAIAFFHGGGFVIGDIDTHDPTCRALCWRTGCLVASVEYRLAPEHRFPAALDEAYDATEWLVAHAAELGADPRRVAVAGDSAGGNLAAAVSLRARRVGGPALAAQALVYPVVDLSREHPSYEANASGYLLTRDAMRWFRAQYLADHEPTDPEVSPLCAADLRGLPPAVVATAGFDPLRDEGRAYAARLRQAGVAVDELRFDNLVHGFTGLGAICSAAARASEATWDAFGSLLGG